MPSFLNEIISKYNIDLETKVFKWNDSVSAQSSVTKSLELDIDDWILDLEYAIFSDPDSGIGEKRLDRHNILLRCRINESKFNIPFTIKRKNFLNQLFRKKTDENFLINCKDDRFREHLINFYLLEDAYSEQGFRPFIQTWREKGNFYFSMGYEGMLGVIEKETLFMFHLGKELIKHIEDFR